MGVGMVGWREAFCVCVYISLCIFLPYVSLSSFPSLFFLCRHRDVLFFKKVGGKKRSVTRMKQTETLPIQMASSFDLKYFNLWMHFW